MSARVAAVRQVVAKRTSLNTFARARISERVQVVRK